MTYKEVFEGTAHHEEWDLFDGIGLENEGEWTNCIISVAGIKQLIGKQVRITVEEVQSQSRQDHEQA